MWWSSFGLKLTDARGVKAVSVRLPSKLDVVSSEPTSAEWRRAAKFGRTAEKIGLAEDCRVALVVGVAAAGETLNWSLMS